MLASFLAFLGGLIPAAIKAFLSRKSAAAPSVEFIEGEKTGAAERAVATAEAQAKTEAAIATAEVAAPATVAATISALNSGTF